MSQNGNRELAINLAWRMWGLPYIWGGDAPVDGFDCSGMVIEILKSVGRLPRIGDWTADGLLNLFAEQEVNVGMPGCLVFYCNAPNDQAVHVEFLVSEDLSIGASGGGRRTITWRDAVTQNAYIKVRPWITRRGVKILCDPFMEV